MTEDGLTNFTELFTLFTLLQEVFLVTKDLALEGLQTGIAFSKEISII